MTYSDRAVTAWRPTLHRMVGDVERKERLAYAIRYVMDRQGVSPDDIAASLGVTARTVRRWRSGGETGTMPSLLEVGPLADVLNVDPRLFIDPPPVPEYQIDHYFLSAEQSGREEGRRRAERLRGDQEPGTPPSQHKPQLLGNGGSPSPREDQ